MQLQQAVRDLSLQVQQGEAERQRPEQRLLAVQGRARSRVGVDTRTPGRPDAFAGYETETQWRDWAIVFRSYAALVNPDLDAAMQQAKQNAVPMRSDAFGSDELKAASTDLYHLLLHLVKGVALDKVINAGPGGAGDMARVLQHIRTAAPQQSGRPVAAVASARFHRIILCSAGGVRTRDEGLPEHRPRGDFGCHEHWHGHEPVAPGGR